ncbi:hypothetical protein HGRIS_004218 [Hohenbuehelia grisea]|uniref:Uncharacterized protein n=1 Tax=Hohenbuehelia grisea TaxID=104357 RepID=A0ABR3JIN8_9AGAR
MPSSHNNEESLRFHTLDSSLPWSYDSEDLTSLTETSETWETASTVSTIWGPGTLSGKAIKALGEATLRGVEKVVIRWRLATINSSLNRNPDSPSGSVDKLEKILDDVLELSRLDFYTPKVRQQALRLIMMQIGSLETTQLIKCVVKWPAEEIQIFLSEFMMCMPLLWNDVDAPDYQWELLELYKSSQSASAEHPLIPFLTFLQQLSEAGPDACHAIISGGYLNLLSDMYEYHSLDFGESDDQSIIAASVITSCNSVLSTFLLQPEALKFLSDHSETRNLWPQKYKSLHLSLHSRILSSFNPKMRRQTWRQADVSRILQRYSEIEVILRLHPVPRSMNLHICIDLLEFLATTKEPKLKQRVLHLILRCVAMGNDFWSSFHAVFQMHSYDTLLDLFYRIIYPLFKWPAEPLPIAAMFVKDVESYLPGRLPIDHFVEFAFELADRAPIAQALMDAEILTLLPATQLDRGLLYTGLQKALEHKVTGSLL